MPHYDNPWTTLSSRFIYENPWISIREDQVLNPASKPGIYGLVSFRNLAIGVLPIDEQGYTYLVGQYRYTLNAYSWEIPEGGCPIGQETPLETAQRELLEETGLVASQWSDMGQLHTSNSVTDETAYLFLAQGLTQGQASPEETEELQVLRMPFAQALDWVLQGKITDALSVAAILRHQVSISQNK